jgi:hypothetical protein
LLLETPREIILLGVLLMAALYFWLPRSGHYVIQQDKPFSPLLKDERERANSLRAGAYAFVVLVIMLAGTVLTAVFRDQHALSVDWISTILSVGMMVWFGASLWMHRSM